MTNRTGGVDGSATERAGSIESWRRDKFWADSIHACAPLGLWAAHFFGSYMFVAIGCRARLDSQAVLGIPLLTLGLTVLTLAALAGLALMLIGPVGELRRQRQRRHHADVPPDSPSESSRGTLAGATTFRIGAVALSLVAVAWTAVPMMLFHSCLQ